ncbi:hypothetical protein J5N97_020352 [Dioscorea zingiberensis]|uniref:TF-B3 domain-containing protein n=1 Tax=Dioscorea zingiberensis TaxID=325984 RepID=A0A9D5HDQ7_9LILI|nr:hypothetical protein J5N97_020352 [Dioscorea zingiberensis]
MLVMLAQEQHQQPCTESIKSHGKKSSSSFTPLSFFKIMIGDFTQVMFLPPKVAKTLSGLLNQNVDIEDANGHRWGVKVASVDNRLAFEQGWQDFVLDHSIKIGELLVLNHISAMLFSAKIYAITGCERLEFDDKCITSESKGKKKNEAPSNDFSLRKCQCVGEFDKDIIVIDKESIEKNQATKSAPIDTTDGGMVTRKVGVKRKGEDVHSLETSPTYCDSSKRPHIEITEQVEVQDQIMVEDILIVNETDQISPASPVNENVDVVNVTSGDHSNGDSDFISKGMSHDFVMEEQISDVSLVEVPVKIVSRDSIFMKGTVSVSSINMTASEAKENSCNAIETDQLVMIEELPPRHLNIPIRGQALSTSECIGHGSQNNPETDCAEIADPLIRDSVSTGGSSQGTALVSSTNLIASEAIANSCDALERKDRSMMNEELSLHHCISPIGDQPLSTSESVGHGSQNETEADCAMIVDPFVRNSVLAGDSPQGNIAVSSIDPVASEANGNSCDTLETAGNSCDTLETADRLVMNEELSPHNCISSVRVQALSTSKCSGHGLQNETEANCDIIMNPLISDKVLTGDSPQVANTDEDIEIKLRGDKTNSSELFDHEMLSKEQGTEEIPDSEGNLNVTEGAVFKFLGTLQGICYIVHEDFADKLGDNALSPINFCDADEADTKQKTDDPSNEDENSLHILLSVPVNKDPQDEKSGSMGDVKVHISRTENAPGLQTPESASHHTYDIPEFHNDVNVMVETSPQSGKFSDAMLEENEKLGPSPEVTVLNDVKTEGLMIGKMSDELHEGNEKLSPTPEVTDLKDAKPACMDSIELPSPNSFNFRFYLPENINSCLELPNRLPCNFGRRVLGRKVLLLQDPIMRLWPVLFCESKNFSGFIGGWKDFAAANDLKQGDMCEFLLTDREHATFHVCITKA